MDKYRELIDELREYCKGRYPYDGTSLIKRAADTIEELLTLSKTEKVGWIPCSDHLPTEEGEYFVQLENNHMRTAYFAFNLNMVDNFDFFMKETAGFYGYNSGYGYYSMDDVVAWRPLPEPWKGEGNE